MYILNRLTGCLIIWVLTLFLVYCYTPTTKRQVRGERRGRGKIRDSRELREFCCDNASKNDMIWNYCVSLIREEPVKTEEQRTGRIEWPPFGRRFDHEICQTKTSTKPVDIARIWRDCEEFSYSSSAFFWGGGKLIQFSLFTSWTWPLVTWHGCTKANRKMAVTRTRHARILRVSPRQLVKSSLCKN